MAIVNVTGISGINSITAQSDTLNFYTASGATLPISAGALNVGTGASVSSPATNVLVLGTNNTEAVRIDSSGRVGIGTTNPDTNLHIQRSSAQNDTHGILKIESTNSTSGAATNSSLITKNKYGWSQFMQWENLGVRVGCRSTTGGGLGDVYLTSGNDSVAMVIKSSGNTGVGTTNPSSLLHVNGDVLMSSLNGGSISGARNRIINGGMDIWQRGTSTTATGTAFLADRWAYQFATGGTISQDTSNVPTGSRYVWKFTASASNAYLQMGQQIEYMNCFDLQGQTVAISFFAKANNTNSGSTSLIVRTRTGASIDSTIYFSGTNSDSSITLTTSWVKYTIVKTLPSTFGALTLEFVLGSHVSGDGFAISQVQLELGNVATPFERRSYGQELALAQRYYQEYIPGAQELIYSESNGASGKFWQVLIRVPMRIAPNVTFNSGITGGAVVGLTGTVSSLGVEGVTVNRVSVRVNMSGNTGSANLMYHCDSFANDPVYLNAEF